MLFGVLLQLRCSFLVYRRSVSGKAAIQRNKKLLQRSTISRSPRPEDSQIAGSWFFQCASVYGSQRTLLWQSGCDLCLAGSPTLGPCRHQGKSASVQAFNCFEVTAFGDPPVYDYLILLAFFFLDPDVEHVDAVFQADAAVLFPAGRQSCSETTPAPTSNNKKHQRCDVTRIITNLDAPIHALSLSVIFNLLANFH